MFNVIIFVLVAAAFAVFARKFFQIFAAIGAILEELER